MRPEPPFARTVCNCAAEVQYCRDRPGRLIPGDLERIAAFLQLGVEECLQLHFRASGRVRVSGLSGIRTVWTLVPIKRAEGCTFLTAAGRCRIHEVAPFGCAYFDSHMGTAEGTSRGAWGIRVTEGHPEYSAQIDRVRGLPVVLSCCRIEPAQPLEHPE